MKKQWVALAALALQLRHRGRMRLGFALGLAVGAQIREADELHGAVLVERRKKQWMNYKSYRLKQKYHSGVYPG